MMNVGENRENNLRGDFFNTTRILNCYFIDLSASGTKNRPQNKPEAKLGAAPSCWQGQKDSNPRHTVLETVVLPTELYPYEKTLNENSAKWCANRDSNPGPTGYEPVALTN